jgi:hypothetical protein
MRDPGTADLGDAAAVLSAGDRTARSDRNRRSYAWRFHCIIRPNMTDCSRAKSKLVLAGSLAFAGEAVRGVIHNRKDADVGFRPAGR